MSTWIPQEGDRCVDYRRTGTAAGPQNSAGATMTVRSVTPTMVITSTGERYRRFDLHPLSEGPHSARTLVRADDEQVQVVRGVDMIRDMEAMVANLSRVDHPDPESVIAALCRIVRVADQTRRTYLKTIYGSTEEG